MKVWLLQRLSKPIKTNPNNPLAKAHRVFGGGMLGLSEMAWDILDQIWNIDYMGAAEFEFGELPKCLGRMIKIRETYKTMEVTIPAKVIKSMAKKASWIDTKGNILPATVYLIAP